MSEALQHNFVPGQPVIWYNPKNKRMGTVVETKQGLKVETDIKGKKQLWALIYDGNPLWIEMSRKVESPKVESEKAEPKKAILGQEDFTLSEIHAINKKSMNKAGKNYQQDYKDFIDKYHKEAIVRALAEGKTLRPEVLADYPYLVKPAPVRFLTKAEMKREQQEFYKALKTDIAAILPKIKPVLLGDTDTIKSPTRKYDVQYALVPFDQVIASHDELSFAKSPEYPAQCQERNYHTDKTEQYKVLNNTKNFDPRFVVSKSPTATDGPPVVLIRDGKYIVIGGNSRAMTIKRFCGDITKNPQTYFDYVQRNLDQFGITGDAQGKMLVRVVTNKDADISNCSRVSRDLNESFIQAKDQNTEAASMAKSISMSTLDTLSAVLEKYDSLADFYSSSDARIFIDALETDGIITANNSNKYLLPNGMFTDEAKDIITKMLVAQIITDKDHLAMIGKTLTNKIAYIIPQLISLKYTDWDVSDQVRKIAELDIKKGGVSDLNAFLSQKSMFDEIVLTNCEYILALAFQDYGVRKLKEKFVVFLTSARANSGIQLFDKIEKPEAIDKIFAADLKSKLKFKNPSIAEEYNLRYAEDFLKYHPRPSEKNAHGISDRLWDMADYNINRTQRKMTNPANPSYLQKYVINEIKRAIAAKKISDKKKILLSLSVYIGDNEYILDDDVKGATADNIDYAIDLKSNKEINRALKIALNAFNEKIENPLSPLAMVRMARAVKNPKANIWLSVDGQEPITYNEFYKTNTEPGVDSLTKKEFLDIKKLNFGETLYCGMGVSVKRVAEPLSSHMARAVKNPAKPKNKIYEQAKALGRRACFEGKKRVPALDKGILFLIGENNGKALEILDAWIHGWDYENLAGRGYGKRMLPEHEGPSKRTNPYQQPGTKEQKNEYDKIHKIIVAKHNKIAKQALGDYAANKIDFSKYFELTTKQPALYEELRLASDKIFSKVKNPLSPLAAIRLARAVKNPTIGKPSKIQVVINKIIEAAGKKGEYVYHENKGIGGEFHLKVNNEPYMSLVIEVIGKEPKSGQSLISVCHYGEQNGDPMRDPEIVYEVQGGTWVPVYFRNDYAGYEKDLATRRDSSGKITRIIPDGVSNIWAKNLVEQGFIDAARNQGTPRIGQGPKRLSNPANIDDLIDELQYQLIEANFKGNHKKAAEIQNELKRLRNKKVEPSKHSNPRGKYFDANTLDELKQQYRTLAKKHHPDLGGDVATMQAINREYDSFLNKVTDGIEDHEERAEEIRLAQEYKDKVNIFAGIPDVKIELIGSWLWITGNTYQYRQILKTNGFWWAKKKSDMSAWFWRPESARTRGRNLDLDTIRRKYGTQAVKPETQKRAIANPSGEWDKDNVEELLDAIGQDDIKWKSDGEGVSAGDWGVVKFFTMREYGTNELRLIFKNNKIAKQAQSALSNALSNPYEFFSRFDELPNIIMVQFTDDGRIYQRKISNPAGTVSVPYDKGLALLARATVIKVGRKNQQLANHDLFATADGRWLLVIPGSQKKRANANVSGDTKELYKQFRQYDIDHTGKVNIPFEKGMTLIGTITAIEYDSDKMIYKTDKRAGSPKMRTYVHKFDNPPQIFKLNAMNAWVIGSMSKPVTHRGIEA